MTEYGTNPQQPQEQPPTDPQPGGWQAPQPGPRPYDAGGPARSEEPAPPGDTTWPGAGSAGSGEGYQPGGGYGAGGGPGQGANPGQGEGHQPGDGNRFSDAYGPGEPYVVPEPAATPTQSWQAGHPEWGRPQGGPVPGRGGIATVLVLALMVLSAVGGGIAGAALYSQAAGDGGGSAGGATRVVDAPQLDYTSLGSIASQVSPSVVSIRVGEFGGSGVVMSDEGYILTNAHVVEVSQNAQVSVRFSNGETAGATVVGADRRSDIAVIRVDGVSDLVPASFGNSDDVLVGDTVLAIGSPLGYEGSVTQGIVSALDRTLRPDDPGAPTLSGLVQTDAAINRGNSGGALVNLAGEVVGINTAIAVQDENSGFLGLGFAVPSNRAVDVAERLIGGEEVNHAFLGVRVAPSPEGGAVIGEVTPDSPADQAGLREGDVLLRMGERQITDANDVVSTVQAAQPGDAVEVEFRRDGVTDTTTVTLGEAPD